MSSTTRVTLPRLTFMEPANDNPTPSEPRQSVRYPLLTEFRQGRMGRHEDEHEELRRTEAWLSALFEYDSITQPNGAGDAEVIAEARLVLRRVRFQTTDAGFRHLEMAIVDRASMTDIAAHEAEGGEGAAKAGRAYVRAALRAANKVRLDLARWARRDSYEIHEISPLGPDAGDFPPEWREAANDDLRRTGRAA